MNREYIKSVAYYADCLMCLLIECGNADFDNLDMLRRYIDD